MTTQQEWTAIGRFVAMVVKLFTSISKVFKEKRLSIELLEWLVNDGKKILEKKMGEIAEEYQKWASVIVVKVTGVNRTLTPQQVLYATGVKQYVYNEVLETLPRGEGDEKEIVFFKAGKSISDDDLEKEFELFGLRPADPYSLAKFNQDNPGFADTHPHCTHWKDENGKWCFIAFYLWGGDVRSAQVGRNRSDWDALYLFACFRR